MSRYAPSGVSYSFGPGAMTPAVRAIVVANVGVYVATLLLPELMIDLFGLKPQAFLERGRLWQIVTYLFLHDPGSVMHILLNMLTLWLFGVDLERRWGTQAFARYYFLTGIGAGVSTIVVSLLPLDSVRPLYGVPTIGASGAIYGVLLAFALVFPHRTIFFMMLFPMPARVYVGIIGVIAFLSAVRVSGGVVNEFAHLGGMFAGWLYLKGPTNFRLDMKYRLTKWRMDRMRRKFDVHRGGRDDDNWKNRVH